MMQTAHISIPWILACTLLAGQGRDVGVVGEHLRPGAEQVALLVGLDRYGQSDALATLRYAAKDVRDLAVVLRGQGFLVHEMRDGGGVPMPVNAESIRQELRRLAKDAAPGSTILFYFSGHGFGVQREGVALNFVCPYDADPSRLEATGLGLHEVEAILNGPDCKAARKLMIIDACRNVPGGRNIITGYSLAHLKASRGLGHLYSTAPGKRSWEPTQAMESQLGGTVANGLFTHFLLQGLRGGAEINQDGFVTFRELTFFVGEEMRKLRLKIQGYEQEPFIRWDGPASDDVLLSAVARAKPPVVDPGRRPDPVTPVPTPGRAIATLDDFLAEAQGLLAQIKGTRLYGDYMASVRKLENGSQRSLRALPGRRVAGAFWNEAWIKHGHLLETRKNNAAKREAATKLNLLFDTWWTGGGEKLMSASVVTSPASPAVGPPGIGSPPSNVTGNPVPPPRPAAGAQALEEFLAKAQAYLVSLRRSAVAQAYQKLLKQAGPGAERTRQGLPGSRHPGSLWGAAWTEHGHKLQKGTKAEHQAKREAAAALHALFDQWWQQHGNTVFGR